MYHPNKDVGEADASSSNKRMQFMDLLIYLTNSFLSALPNFKQPK